MAPADKRRGPLPGALGAGPGAGCGGGAALVSLGAGAAPGGLLLPSPLAASALAALLIFALYRLTACPGAFLPPDKGLPAPAYLLLLPGNASSLPPPYPLHLLPPDDRDVLIDVRPFSFRAPGPRAGRACPSPSPSSLSSSSSTSSSSSSSGQPPLLLVLVHSAPGNGDKRRAIRATWASPGDPRLRVLFLLGSVDSADDQRRIDLESAAHGDLVQGSFRDSYRNMTYKHVMALKWTAYHCPGARYLLKTDDDVFVNSPALLRFLSRELSPWGARRLILCAPFPFAYVKRSWRSKWRVSPREYPGRTYPSYCAGWAVLYSPDAVFLLYREAQRTPYFWIDDVHVTGTLAARANLSHTPLGSLALTEAQVDALLAVPAGASPPPVTRHFLFGAPNLPQSAIYRLWELVAPNS